MKIDPNVRRVLVQVVDAACNSFARFMADKCRHMMSDELPAAASREEISHAYYIAGRNDVLRELAKYLETRAEFRAVIEATADATRVMVDDVRRDVP